MSMMPIDRVVIYSSTCRGVPEILYVPSTFVLRINKRSLMQYSDSRWNSTGICEQDKPISSTAQSLIASLKLPRAPGCHISMVPSMALLIDYRIKTLAVMRLTQHAKGNAVLTIRDRFIRASLCPNMNDTYVTPKERILGWCFEKIELWGYIHFSARVSNAVTGLRKDGDRCLAEEVDLRFGSYSLAVT